ncbi:AIG2-like family-domain-containing protein [Lophiotrema nucula]|uniref:Putative gamma-glutamylcyclotransferase n=1 Tax=Lophiotrema nucula TaxID=690887 RepID=A0A6A5Z2H1_9PLEO|nr:AIG2-like family-domain-containing protein [Lophiotrema nucula]
MSHTAFFYGTLMAPQVLHRVIWGNTNPPQIQKDILHIRPAILHKFRRHKVRFADYPAIVPANSTGSVRGTLVTGLTDGDIWRLDIFEGDEYERIKVKVRVLEQKEEGMGDVELKEEDNVEGEEVEAEVYAWIAGKNRLEPEEWDFGEFVREKLHRWAGREAEDVDSGFQGRQSIIGVFGRLVDGVG